MIKKSSWMKVFQDGFVGGTFIVAAMVFSSLINNPVLAAFVFPIGIFMCFTFGHPIVTGRAVVDSSLPISLKDYWRDLSAVIVGNLIGVLWVISLSQVQKVGNIAPLETNFTNIDWIMLALNSVFVTCLIGLSYIGYLHNQGIVKIFATFIPVAVFVLFKLPHCVVYMGRFWLSPSWCGLVQLIVVILGNLFGGAVFNKGYRYFKNKEIWED